MFLWGDFWCCIFSQRMIDVHSCLGYIYSDTCFGAYCTTFMFLYNTWYVSTLFSLEYIKSVINYIMKNYARDIKLSMVFCLIATPCTQLICTLLIPLQPCFVSAHTARTNYLCTPACYLLYSKLLLLYFSSK